MALVRRRGAIQSEKFTRKRRKKTIFVVILFVLAIGSMVSALSLFSRANFLQIQSVKVENAENATLDASSTAFSIISPDEIQSTVNTNLNGNATTSGNWFYFLSKNSLFLYPKATIRDELMKKFPAIASVDFQSSGDILGFGHDIILHIMVTERKPFALACENKNENNAGDKISAVNQNCFYVDDSGFVYAPAPQFSSGVFVRYEMASSSATPSSSKIILGTPLTNEDAFTTSKKIVATISGMGFDVVADTIGTDVFGQKNELAVGDTSSVFSTTSTSSTTLTTTLYFNESEPATTALQYFSDFWHSVAVGTTTKFQYVDLRYGKDIVYKIYQ